MEQLLIIFFLLLFPALVLKAEKTMKPVQWLGGIVVCYLAGLLLGNLPGVSLDLGIRTTISEISVSLAVPCLLFSANILAALRFAKKSLFSFLLCALAVSISASFAWYFLQHQLANAATLAGMLAGVYTGGTPNLSAIATALDAPQELFGLVNTIDMALSGAYLLFLFSVARPLLKRCLPEKQHLSEKAENSHTELLFTEKPSFRSALTTLGLGVLILGLSAGIALLISGSMPAPLVILGLSTFGLIASSIPTIHGLKGSYRVANYLLLIFSLAVGSLANIQQLIQASDVVLLFCSTTMVGAVLIHYLLARFFKIDVDTVLVTSTAAIFGPVFVGPVINRLPAKELLLPGIAVGLLGYALGNYLGIGLSYLLASF